MTQQLPTPGGDGGTWGDMLNGFLEVSHASDGTLNPGVVSNSQLDNSTQTAIAKAVSAIQSVNGKTGASVTLAASDVSAVSTNQLGVAGGVATLDNNLKLTDAQLPNSAISTGLLTSSYYNVYNCQGSGIDPTGATDSTAGINTLIASLPAGSTLMLPDSATFMVAGNITIGQSIKLTGRGALNATFGSSYTSTAVVIVEAPGVVIDGVQIFNPNYVYASPGPGISHMGIKSHADDTVIRNCLIDKMQAGIWCNGSNPIIIGNHVRNVLGYGGGPTSTTTGAVASGEAGGDGIYCTGAQATITGNVVNCIGINWVASTAYAVGQYVVTFVDGYVYECTTAGTSGSSTPAWPGVIGNTVSDGSCVWTCVCPGGDARIGIGMEGISGEFEEGQPAHAHAQYSVSGNVVFGKFRRSMVSESMTYAAITGNTLADATWWSMAAGENTHGILYSGNTVLWTRTSQDLQGSAWDPNRCPIMFYQGTGNAAFNNAVYFEPNSVATALAEFYGIGTGNAQPSQNNTVDSNVFNIDPTASVNNGGFFGEWSNHCRFSNNRVFGSITSNCIYGYDPICPIAVGNDFHPISTVPQNAVSIQGPSGVTIISGNSFIGVASGITIDIGAGIGRITDNIVIGVGATHTVSGSTIVYNSGISWVSSLNAFTSTDAVIIPSGANISDSLVILAAYTGSNGPAWVASTSYRVGQVVASGGLLYQCTTAGTSGSPSAPSWPSSAGSTVNDGSVTWTTLANGTYVAKVAGPMTAGSGNTVTVATQGNYGVYGYDTNQVAWSITGNISSGTMATAVSGFTNGQNGQIVANNN